MKSHAIVVKQQGGPEVMHYQQIELAAPQAGQVLLRNLVCGVNYIDIYQRSGLYPLPAGGILGQEAVGIVEAVGAGVDYLSVGDRVAYYQAPGYCQHQLVDSAKTVQLPEALESLDVAATLLKGLTVECLLFRICTPQAGQTVLFHAAAGGVGLLFCQWAAAIGVKVIGTVGSNSKAELARKNGCWQTINYNEEDFHQRVLDLTQGQGVPLVYDSVGKDTLAGSLASLQAFGTLVSFGNSSGAVPPFSLFDLRGSLKVCRPSLAAYTHDVNRYRTMCQRLFSALLNRSIQPHHYRSYPLEQAAQAHRELASRQTSGSLTLLPESE